jgi:hypothetical protein
VPGAYLFVLRSVFGTTGDDDFFNGNQAPLGELIGEEQVGSHLRFPERNGHKQR